jgi:hypothetical protein
VPLCISLGEEENFGSEGGNSAGRDRDLIRFASPDQLLSAEDGRWKRMGYTINQIPLSVASPERRTRRFSQHEFTAVEFRCLHRPFLRVIDSRRRTFAYRQRHRLVQSELHPSGFSSGRCHGHDWS